MCVCVLIKINGRPDLVFVFAMGKMNVRHVQAARDSGMLGSVFYFHGFSSLLNFLHHTASISRLSTYQYAVYTTKNKQQLKYKGTMSSNFVRAYSLPSLDTSQRRSYLVRYRFV